MEYGKSIQWYLDNKGCPGRSLAPLAVHENRTDIFPMYFDFDCKFTEDHKPTYQTLVEWCRAIQDVCKRFYPAAAAQLGTTELPTEFRMFLATAPLKQKNNTNITHLGVHIVMDKLRVNLKRALRIRKAVVARFEELYGDAGLMGANWGDHDISYWESTIDNAVYRQGLRMIGSIKKSKCSKCKESGIVYVNVKITEEEEEEGEEDDCEDGKGGIGVNFKSGNPNGEPRARRIIQREEQVQRYCDACGGTGKADEERAYIVKKVIKSDGEYDHQLTETLKTNFVEAVQYTRLRLYKHEQILTEGYVVYDGCPAPTPLPGMDLGEEDDDPLDEIISPVGSSDPMGAASAKTRKRKRSSKSVTGDDSSYTLDDHLMDDDPLRKRERTMLENKGEYRRGEKKKLNMVQLPYTDPIYVELQNAIQGLSPKWQRLRISKISHDQDRWFYSVTVKGEGSSWCENLEPARSHGASTIYFHVTTEGIYQRCFCQKSETKDRKKSLDKKTRQERRLPCKEYSEHKGYLPPPLVARMFPGCPRAMTMSKTPISFQGATTTTNTSSSSSSSTRTKSSSSSDRMDNYKKDQLLAEKIEQLERRVN